MDTMKDFVEVMDYFSNLAKRCYSAGVDTSCQNSSYFHCRNSSKCISYHRVQDGFSDSYYNVDETFDACQFNDSKRFRCKSYTNKCLSPIAVGNDVRECSDAEDEIYVYHTNSVALTPFPFLCNKNRVRDWQLSREDDRAAENCDWWPCDTPYTHCNNAWDCPNGIDELNCSDTICQFNKHECINQQTSLSYCLPVTNMFDNIIENCSKLTIERKLYFGNETNDLSEYYYSWNISKCITSEKICRHHSQKSLEHNDVCLQQTDFLKHSFKLDVCLIRNKDYLCTIRYGLRVLRNFHILITRRSGYFPKPNINISVSSITKTKQKKMILSNINIKYLGYCHQGIVVLTDVNQTKKCLCPPNYFGNRCQWQNQRISLTLQFLLRTKISLMNIFRIIIMLIDEQGQIVGDHEQITYMPVWDRNTKYNIYLLYQNRPKNLSINYSIRIDAFDKITLNYWISWYLPIPYSFLPVNRIATRLHIHDIEDRESCSLSCGNHGQCMRYTNNKSLFFCQCEHGYSGPKCNIH
ncbi:unnamed protein product [Rotaria sp. Silwood2]|nr:unnamed protein product [Rotaria sp. Silwood2]CAF4370654.1 unnamed protein product [Rotaria sp. Silwood2]